MNILIFTLLIVLAFFGALSVVNLHESFASNNVSQAESASSNATAPPKEYPRMGECVYASAYYIFNVYYLNCIESRDAEWDTPGTW